MTVPKTLGLPETQLTVIVEPTDAVSDGMKLTIWSPGLKMPVRNSGAADGHMVIGVVVVVVVVVVDVYKRNTSRNVF